MSEDSSIDGSLNESSLPNKSTETIKSDDSRANLKIFQKVQDFIETKGFEHLESPLNQKVVEQGYIDLQDVIVWTEGLYDIMLQMSERNEKLRSSAQNMHSIHLQGSHSKESLSNKVQELQNTIQSLEEQQKGLQQRLSQQEDRKGQERGTSRRQEEEHKKKLKNFEQVIQEHERRYRMKELELEKVKQRLVAVAEREVEEKKRSQQKKASYDNTSSFDTSMISSPHSSRKSVASQVESLQTAVQALDKQRRDLQQRNAELETQLRDLLDMQLELEPQSSSRTAERGGEEEEEDSRQELEQQQQAMRREIAQLTRELAGAARRQEAEAERQERLHQELREEVRRGREEIENLQLELQQRPSQRQWTATQRELQEMEAKLHDLVLLRSEAKDLAAWRQHLSTADRIRLDRRNHELGLFLLDVLPKQAMKEALMLVCRELDLSDISQIPLAIDKLKQVVRLVPRMERFIAKVTAFVSDRNGLLNERLGLGLGGGAHRPGSTAAAAAGGGGGEDSSSSSMEAIYRTLQRWWVLVQRCVDLELFREDVLFEVYRANELLLLPQNQPPSSSSTAATATATRQAELLSRWEDEGRNTYLMKDATTILAKLHAMADLQLEVFQGQSSLQQAQRFLLDRPDVMVNRLVQHLLYLLEIKSLDGLLPRVNQLYCFSEEMKNFLSAVKRALGRDKSTPQAVVIDEVLQRIGSSSSSSSGGGNRHQG